MNNNIKIVRNQRKNADGSYDIVHPETQAKAVWFEDGESLQQKMGSGGGQGLVVTFTYGPGADGEDWVLVADKPFDEVYAAILAERCVSAVYKEQGLDPKYLNLAFANTNCVKFNTRDESWLLDVELYYDNSAWRGGWYLPADDFVVNVTAQSSGDETTFSADASFATIRDAIQSGRQVRLELHLNDGISSISCSKFLLDADEGVMFSSVGALGPYGVIFSVAIYSDDSVEVSQSTTLTDSMIGEPYGIATLDSTGKVPSEQLPDDVKTASATAQNAYMLAQSASTAVNTLTSKGTLGASVTVSGVSGAGSVSVYGDYTRYVGDMVFVSLSMRIQFLSNNTDIYFELWGLPAHYTTPVASCGFGLTHTTVIGKQTVTPIVDGNNNYGFAVAIRLDQAMPNETWYADLRFMYVKK